MPETRPRMMERLAADSAFDAIVVGGGINGIGTFRDLALQGLRVLLVERADFCSGCSAAPSRMIHGGLRYLENGEFGLVRESLAERDLLLANAPHMVRPLPTTIPISSRLSGTLNGIVGFLGLTQKPSQRGALPIKFGLQLYDWITRKRRVLPKHQFRSREETCRAWPDLRKDILYSATYHDAWISYPERLGIELIADALEASPKSLALNYAALETGADGAYQLRDHVTGETAGIGLETRTLVIATGAWLDETLESIAPSAAASGPLVSGTKGSHLVLDNPALLNALGGHMIFFENSDARVCIMFPYLGKVLAGSTDIRVRRAERVRCEDDERDYILASIRKVFPEIALSPRDIVFSYSGIRPLPTSDHEFTGRITRGHEVRRVDGATPTFCMIGGKWTTFRAFAEQTTDQVLAELGVRRQRSTKGLPFGGGRNFPTDPASLDADLTGMFGLTPDRARHLADHYGTTAFALLQVLKAEGPDRPLAAQDGYSIGEIGHLVETEFVVHLSDLVLRRTSLAITGEITRRVLDTIAALMAERLGWDEARTAEEIDATISELETYHGVSAATLETRSKTKEP